MTEKAKNQDINISTQLSIPETRYDLQILRSLRRIMRAIDLYSHKLKTSYQLTAPQLICLLCIVEEGTINVTTISKKVFLSPSTIVGILDRLETRDLVFRERDSKDRRIVNVTALEKGIKLAKTVPSPLQDNLANSLKKLPLLEQSTIDLSLKRVVDLMEADQLEAAPILETGQLDKVMLKSANLKNVLLSKVQRSKEKKSKE
ncbi:MAG: MarR family transcriptional regulator [candidate division Zixibacteria bacterium]|nr:MarR family transcriptional regulator [candidate division Zixibacteria bacterium]